jgi:hypothetical protein
VPGQDGQDRTASTGQLEHDKLDRTAREITIMARTGQTGKDSRTRQVRYDS